MINLPTTWNEERLEKEVIRFIKIAENHYNKSFLKYKLPQININSRLSSALGRVCATNGKVDKIEFAEYLIKGYTDEFIIGVIGHEVAHYIMFLIYKVNQNHNANFKSLCRVFGVNGGTRENEHRKYMKEEYKEYLKEKAEIEKTKSQKPQKSMKIRYVRTCPFCNARDYKKVAKDGSIKKWVSNFYCRKHNSKLVVYDLKEHLKYYDDNNTLKKVKMTKAEIENYKNIA